MTFVAVAFLAFLMAIVVFWMAVLEKDVVLFDRLKLRSPIHYRILKWTCRINGPMTALFSVWGIMATPLIFLSPKNGPLVAFATFNLSAIFLWLSIRWLTWSLGT